MSFLDIAFKRLQRAYPKAKIRNSIRDQWGTYAFDILLDGKPFVFCTKRSSGSGGFLSVHSDLTGRRVPILLSWSNKLYVLDPHKILTRYSFRNVRNGAMMLNFKLDDVEAETLERSISKREVDRIQANLFSGGKE